jgi:hypothetical protein
MNKKRKSRDSEHTQEENDSIPVKKYLDGDNSSEENGYGQPLLSPRSHQASEHITYRSQALSKGNSIRNDIG